MTAMYLRTWVTLCMFVVTLAAGCHTAPATSETMSLTIATGGPGGAFYPMGTALATLYSTRLSGVETTILTGGSTQNVEAVEAGRAALGFTQADVAYVAYRRGTETNARPFSDLRGVAMLWMNTVHVAVPRTRAFRSIEELTGKRIAVGTRGSGTETLARIVLESYGIPYSNIHPEFLSFLDTVAAMQRGSIDAAFVVAGLPADAVTDISRNPGVRLLPIPRAQVRAMRAQYPFLQPVVVAGSTYPGIADAVETLGVSSLLVSRKDVDTELVYTLTRELFTALPQLQEAHPAVRLIDAEQAAATPIPLHPGAARYYRERQITQ